MNKLFIKKKNELNQKKKGFTLIELIIVIAIIAVLAAIAVPKFGQVRESANTKADLATAKNIATIVSQKLADGEDVSTAEVTTTDEIGEKLDGNVTPKANGESTFTYKVDNGNVVVTYTTSGTQVYPTTTTTTTTTSGSGQ